MFNCPHLSENGLINSTLAECSTFMVLHHYPLFHILAAIGSTFSPKHGQLGLPAPLR